MSKIRPYAVIDPYTTFWTEVNHFFYDDPYEPGAYHTIYPYGLSDLPPAVDAWQAYPTLELGILAARSWTGRPAMINDICLACRYWDYGAALPRWNIYRGEEHPRPSQAVPPYARHFVPCFLIPWWDPPPPGYGQEP